MSITVAELNQLFPNTHGLVSRVLTGPVGYPTLEPDLDMEPSGACIVALGHWLIKVARFNEGMAMGVLYQIRKQFFKTSELTWSALEQGDDAEVSSFHLGIFENRYVTWAGLEDKVLDTQTGEMLDKMPYPHMWSLVLDNAILIGRLWGDYKRLRERKDAEQRLHQTEADGSDVVCDESDPACTGPSGDGDGELASSDSPS